MLNPTLEIKKSPPPKRKVVFHHTNTKQNNRLIPQAFHEFLAPPAAESLARQHRHPPSAGIQPLSQRPQQGLGAHGISCPWIQRERLGKASQVRGSRGCLLAAASGQRGAAVIRYKTTTQSRLSHVGNTDGMSSSAGSVFQQSTDSPEPAGSNRDTVQE